VYDVPDGGILVLTFRGTVLQQEMLSIFHYQLDAAGGLTDGAAYLDAFLNLVDNAGGLHEKFMDCMSSDYTNARLKAQWIIPTRFAYREQVPTITTGAVASEVAGPNQAVAVNKRTEIAGVHGRGVLHMPGVPKTFTTTGAVNGVGFGFYNAFGDAMQLDVAPLAGPAHPGIFNRTTPGDFPILNNVVVSEKVRTMHRRTVGLGS
jgi:hypothetical protein